MSLTSTEKIVLANFTIPLNLSLMGSSIFWTLTGS